jgi:hypothetical protein
MTLTTHASTQGPTKGPTRATAASIAAAGGAAIAGSVVLGLGCILTQVEIETSPAVAKEVWSHPWSSSTFVVVTLLWGTAQLSLLPAVLGLRSVRATGRSRPERVGVAMAVAGTLLIALGDLVSIPVRDQTIHDLPVQLVGGMFGLGTLASAVGFLVYGVSAIRSRRWTGWSRYVPVGIGVWCAALLALQLTPVFPAMVTGYYVGFALLGWVLVREPV